MSVILSIIPRFAESPVLGGAPNDGASGGPGLGGPEPEVEQEAQLLEPQELHLPDALRYSALRRHRNHRGVGVGAFVRREVDVGACQFHRLAGTLHWSLRAELLDGGLNQTLAVGRV